MNRHLRRPDAPAAGTRNGGFASRLMVSQTLVLMAGALTTWVVASAVGPGLFREHLARAGDTHTASETRHIEEAFGFALLVSMTVALVAAVVAALLVTWYFSRRVQRSIGTVTAAAASVAAGRLDARVPPPGLGWEFDTLAEGYNALAARLETVEVTRRRLLADLAHEMRTPLATVEAHLEAVEDGVRKLDEQTLAVIRSSTGRLRRLAQDISAVSRAEEGGLDTHRRVVDAATIARLAAAAARERYVTKGVALDVQAVDEVTLWADPERIGQVLTNLLDNALRHTPPGGVVTLSCRGRDRKVEYVVADTGSGLAPEHLPHVFDRFYRADTARDRGQGGSGIGLSIVKAYVEAHGGQVSAHSAGLGWGCTFTVLLPTAAT
jgi:two-component system, OmpR family, sensor histidine kinase BaeS